MRARGVGYGSSGDHGSQHADGEAKFWIDPVVELSANFGLKPKQVREAQNLIEEHLNEIRTAWQKHFPGGSH
jgi:hypothetical protein